MSTPRKRWFKVADSILREDWDDATLASAMRLMAWLNQRWARDGIPHSEAGTAVIGEHDAMLITHLRRPKDALKRLASLPLVAGWTSASADLDSAQSPTRCTLKWSKFPEFQEYGPRSRSGGVRENALSGSGSDSDSEDLRTDHVPPEEPDGTAREPANAQECPEAPIDQRSVSTPHPDHDRLSQVKLGASESKQPNGKQAELAVESVDRTEAEVRAVWPACQAAALQLSGKRWGALTPAYLRMAAGCLRNLRKAEARAPPETLVHAIHGAWITFGEGRRQNYDARKYLRPKTVYAASNFDSYVDEYRDSGVSRAAPGSDPESERLREARIAEASRQWRASQGRDEIV